MSDELIKALQETTRATEESTRVTNEVARDIATLAGQIRKKNQVEIAALRRRADAGDELAAEILESIPEDLRDGLG